MRFTLLQRLLFATLCCGPLSAQADTIPTPQPPTNLRMIPHERSIELLWDGPPGAIGYHVFRSDSSWEQARRLNPYPVLSGTRYLYLWERIGKQRVRNVRGTFHRFWITALYPDSSQSPPCSSICTDYFQGFSRIDSAAKLHALLRPTQRGDTLPIPRQEANLPNLQHFIATTGVSLMQLLRDSIDFSQTGACAPVSTIVVKLLKKAGVEAFKAEGVFIDEFHAFTIVIINGVEYVLDFAADQFIPNSSPVLIPRDYCFISPQGRADTCGTPTYRVSRIFRNEDVFLANNQPAELYHAIFKKLDAEPAPTDSSTTPTAPPPPALPALSPTPEADRMPAAASPPPSDTATHPAESLPNPAAMHSDSTPYPHPLPTAPADH
jgi:hypothetical protein